MPQAVRLRREVQVQHAAHRMETAGQIERMVLPGGEPHELSRRLKAPQGTPIATQSGVFVA